jgi:putative hydrolase of the HAD superfamily
VRVETEDLGGTGRTVSIPTPPWNPRDLKACLFDFGGTLDADGVTWQDRFYALYGRHGIDVDREVFRQAFYYADDSLTETRALEGAGLQETLQAQGERVWEALRLNGNSRRMRAIVTDFLEDMKWYVERNRQLLVLLRSRYSLGIVSNFYGNLDRVCEDLGIRDLFLCVVDSSCEGVAKPDPRIFQAALDLTGTRSEEAVFVGDNPSRDMEGAKGVGMPHVLLAGEAIERARPCCPGDPVIPSLDALGPLLLLGEDNAPRGGIR